MATGVTLRCSLSDRRRSRRRPSPPGRSRRTARRPAAPGQQRHHDRRRDGEDDERVLDPGRPTSLLGAGAVPSSCMSFPRTSGRALTWHAAYNDGSRNVTLAESPLRWSPADPDGPGPRCRVALAPTRADHRRQAPRSAPGGVRNARRRQRGLLVAATHGGAAGRGPARRPGPGVQWPGLGGSGERVASPAHHEDTEHALPAPVGLRRAAPCEPAPDVPLHHGCRGHGSGAGTAGVSPCRRYGAGRATRTGPAPSTDRRT